jgi:hypothetical protein
LQGRGVFSVGVGLYYDLHVLIESYEEAQKALHGGRRKSFAQQLTSAAEAQFIFSQLCGTTSRALPDLQSG